ncbi:MAG: hypothetical protein ABTD50_14815 [Polyangiaceae bacterium]
MSDDPQRAAMPRVPTRERCADERTRPLVVQRAAWLFAIGAVLGARRASATDGEVMSDAVAQMYDVRSPTGEVVLERRRLDTTLGINAYDLTHASPADATAPLISFRARLRYSADFGLNAATFDPSQTNDFVPGRQAGAVDVMFAYVEGRRLLGGPLGFRFGRQYVTDVLGWWSFDGLELNATTPIFFRAQVYGGFEQRGGLALGTSHFESDGVWRGSRDGLPSGLYPTFQAASPAPAIGVAIESIGLPWLHARLTARHVYDTGASDVAVYGAAPNAPATVDGMRTSSDRLGGSFNATWSNVAAAQSGFVYDVYLGQVTHVYGALEGRPHPRMNVGVDYDYYVPSFDADSIWNFFAAEPRNDIGLRADSSPSEHLAFAGSAKVRVFTVPALQPGLGDAYERAGAAPTNGHPFDEAVSASARWHGGATAVGFRAAGDFGAEGDRVGGDADAERVFETRTIVRGRLGLWHWDDRLRPGRSALSLGCVAGIGYKFAPRSQGMVEWEQDMNRLVGQRFRVVFSLTVTTGP